MTTQSPMNRGLEEQEAQFRLAYTELARIDREIRELEGRPHRLLHEEPLRSLRACRAALLRMVMVRVSPAQPPAQRRRPSAP